MLRNTSDCQADVDRFIQRVGESEVVWFLANDAGTAYCESNEFEGDEEPLGVLLFFSDEAYARRCQNAAFEEYEISKMSLFDFLFRWLPGMSGDGVLAGLNWNHELVGLEVDPLELREKIEANLSEIQRQSHLQEFERLSQ
jgi:hypothetical protein